MFSEMVLPHVGTMNENQLMLISLLGVKSTLRLISHLDDLLRSHAGRVTEIQELGGDPNLCEAVRANKSTQVKFLNRLALFLNTCMNAPTPETVRILSEQKIGQKLSTLLSQIDPDLRHKNLHVSLTKFFGTLCDSEISNLKNLVVDFEYTVSLYQKHMKKSNLLSCQYDSIFLNMGKFWCSSFLEYVRRNFGALKVLSENRPAVELMLKTYLDEKGNFVTTNPEDSILKKSSEDICMRSESPRSTSYFESLADFAGYGGMGGMSLGIFEESTYKSLPSGKDTEFLDNNKQSISQFYLEDEESRAK